MPDPTPTRTERVLDLVEQRVANPTDSGRTVAARVAMPQSSAQHLLTRYQPVVETLGQIQREPLVALMQLTAIEAADAARGAIDKGEGKSAQSFMIAAGIASEKALLFAGQPTAITAVTHELRSRLPDLLARATRVLEARRQALGPGGPAQGGEAGQDQGAGPEVLER